MKHNFISTLWLILDNIFQKLKDYTNGCSNQTSPSRAMLSLLHLSPSSSSLLNVCFCRCDTQIGAEDEQRTGRYMCISSETEQGKKAAQPQLAMWLLRPATYETFTIWMQTVIFLMIN